MQQYRSLTPKQSILFRLVFITQVCKEGPTYYRLTIHTTMVLTRKREQEEPEPEQKNWSKNKLVQIAKHLILCELHLDVLLHLPLGK